MTLIFKLLVVVLCLTFLDHILVFGRHHQRGTTTPEPVSFPYGLVCIKNIGLRPRDEGKTKKCCKEGGAPCKLKKLPKGKTTYSCIAQSHEARNKTIECCQNAKCIWEKTYQTTGDEDC